MEKKQTAWDDFLVAKSAIASKSNRMERERTAWDDFLDPAFYEKERQREENRHTHLAACGHVATCFRVGEHAEPADCFHCSHYPRTPNQEATPFPPMPQLEHPCLKCGAIIPAGSPTTTLCATCFIPEYDEFAGIGEPMEQPRNDTQRQILARIAQDGRYEYHPMSLVGREMTDLQERGLVRLGQDVQGFCYAAAPLDED